MRRWFAVLVSFFFVLPVSAQDTNPEPMDTPLIYTTMHQLSGNRFIAGGSTFPDVTVEDFTLPGTPNWVVGTELGWVVTTEDGRVWNVRRSVEAAPHVLAPGQPPAVFIASLPGDPMPLMQSPADASTLSHAIQLSTSLIYISEDGELVALHMGGEVSRLPLNIQPDARIVVSRDERIAVYAEATNQRYVHAIMGDDLEGAALVVVRNVDGQLVQDARIELPGDAVFEGLSPFWADVNQDGVPDLVTTVSDGAVGSRIRVYLSGEDGFLAVDGEAIGQPGRWQHQLAWDAFGPEGEMELVEVRTPHIGGIVRFYQYSEVDGLQIVATLNGYTSHVIGSRNLDLAVAGDFNGDGQPEIVMPSQDRTRIAGIQRTPGGAVVAWELPVNGSVVTNLAAVSFNDVLSLAAGTADGRLRVWTP